MEEQEARADADAIRERFEAFIEDEAAKQAKKLERDLGLGDGQTVEFNFTPIIGE